MQKVILGWLWYLGIIPDIGKYLLNVVTAVIVVFISILHFFSCLLYSQITYNLYFGVQKCFFLIIVKFSCQK